MSVENTTAPVVETQAAPVAAPATETSTVSIPREAFNERLARERAAGTRELLESIGIKDPATLKTIVEEHSKRLEGQKTIEERAASTATALEAERTEKAGLLKVVTDRAALEFNLLSPAQKTAVVALAGDDPARRLSAIDALWPTWAAQESQQAASATAVVPVVPATPAQRDTAARPTAPTEAATTAVTDHKSEWERLQKTNPFAAASYAIRHAGQIFVKP